MKDKLMELAERWNRYADKMYRAEPRNRVRECAAELLAILDAEGDGGAVELEYPEFRAQGMGCGLEDRGITDRYEAMRYGFDEALDQMARIIENAGPLYTHPARSGVVSDEDVNYFLDKYEGKRAHPRSYAHIEDARSCLEHFAKGERHER